ATMKYNNASIPKTAQHTTPPTSAKGISKGIMAENITGTESIISPLIMYRTAKIVTPVGFSLGLCPPCGGGGC
ncbi:MAG: hypothetical protein ACOCSL_05610, partial [Thermoplasmatota archaeon]